MTKRRKKEKKKLTQKQIALCILVAIGCLAIGGLVVSGVLRANSHVIVAENSSMSPRPTMPPVTHTPEATIAIPNTPVPTLAPTPVPTPTPIPSAVTNVVQLQAKNKDLYAWLSIPGTDVDYPVMYTAGSDEYLRMDIDKKTSSQGCVVVDKYNKISPRDTNLILHGNRMQDGSMFAKLHEYKDEQYYKTHKTIQLATATEVQEYEIFAVFLSRVYQKTDTVFKYYQFTSAPTKQDFDNYVTNVQKLALFTTGVVPKFGDELIALSTGDSTVANGRLVVAARRVK